MDESQTSITSDNSGNPFVQSSFERGDIVILDEGYPSEREVFFKEQLSGHFSIVIETNKFKEFKVMTKRLSKLL